MFLNQVIHGRMVVGFTTTFVISAYHNWSCEFESISGGVYSIQHSLKKFVSDLQQVGGFLRHSGFLHQWNWPPQYNRNIVEGGVNRYSIL